MSAVTPYVLVYDANAFVRFIEATFDADVSIILRLPSDPKRVVHAEARVGDALLYFADSGPDGGQCLPPPTEPAHIQLWTVVPDADAAYDRALAAGANSAVPVAPQADGSRFGGFVDPFGTLWWVTTAADA
jgi:PhnB protein